jgi:hypothetical protein
MQWGNVPRFHRAVGKSLGLKSGPPERPHSASSDLGVIAAVLPGRAPRTWRARVVADFLTPTDWL